MGTCQSLYSVDQRTTNRVSSREPPPSENNRFPATARFFSNNNITQGSYSAGFHSSSNRNRGSSTDDSPSQDQVHQLLRDLEVMENFFQSLLGQGYSGGGAEPAGFHPGMTQQPPINAGQIPASQRSIRQVPNVLVTPEDLADENNRECCICLEENKQGAKVARLPCGHLYHRQCIEEWLNKNCTCPVCRYELETDDSNYEIGRLQRMSSRRPRYRRYELDRMPVHELRQLSQRLKVSIVGITEKRELVERIVNCGKVDILSSPDPLEFRLSDLRKLGVGMLKKTMNNGGVFFDPVHVVEKEDMVQIFINSGRVLVLEEEIKSDKIIDDTSRKNDYAYTDYTDEKSEDARNGDTSGNNEDACVSYHSDVSGETPLKCSSSDADHERRLIETDCNQNATEENDIKTPPTVTDHHFEEYPSISDQYSSLSSYSIKQLRNLAKIRGVNVSDCVEKRDMVERIWKSNSANF